MNWLEFISQLAPADKETKFDFNTPVPHDVLQTVRHQFNLAELPDELEELYKQTNGIREKINEEVTGELIWPIERVIETNKEYRKYPQFKTLYMSFDQILFISDAGNGDLFGFVTLNGRFDRPDIFVWNHEDDSRTWVAPNLKKFIEWWTNGIIKV